MRPQVDGLINGQPEAEVVGEASLVTTNLLVKVFGQNAKEGRQVRGDHGLTPTDEIYGRMIREDVRHIYNTNEGAEKFPDLHPNQWLRPTATGEEGLIGRGGRSMR